MQKRNSSFIVTARDKDITLKLLDFQNIPIILRGRGSKNRVGRYIDSIFFLLRNTWRVRKFNPDICISIGSAHMVSLAWLIRKPCIIFEDTESAKQLFWIYRHFSDVILTPSCFKLNLGSKHIYFNGYKELAYLHKNNFIPDESIYQLLGIDKSTPYILFRSVSHRVHHDKPGDGLTAEMKEKLIRKLSSFARVFISTEKGIPQQFPELEINIPLNKMHDVIAFSKLVIGESSTMAAEAAILGVPSIFFDNYGRGYTDELSDTYHLVNNYKISHDKVNEAIDKALEILKIPDYTNSHTLYNQLLKDKIDVTAFMIWFVENFPASFNIMKQDPGIQNRFK